MPRTIELVTFVFVAVLAALVTSLSPLVAQTAKVRVQPEPISLLPTSIQELTGTMISTGEVIAWGNRLKAPFSFRVTGTVVDVVSPDGIYRCGRSSASRPFGTAFASAFDRQVFDLQERVDAIAIAMCRQERRTKTC